MSGDVVDLIKQDHREVERLFDTLTNNRPARALVLPQVAALLLAHQRAEEAEVYPVARQEAGETEEVEHSDEEHEQAARLLQRLRSVTDLHSQEFDDLLHELVEDVSHHVSEEENNVLPGISSALGDGRRAELGRAFAARRAAELERGDSGIDPAADMTKEALRQQAKQHGIPSQSRLSKHELADRLKKI